MIELVEIYTCESEVGDPLGVIQLVSGKGVGRELNMFGGNQTPASPVTRLNRISAGYRFLGFDTVWRFFSLFITVSAQSLVHAILIMYVISDISPCSPCNIC